MISADRVGCARIGQVEPAGTRRVRQPDNADRDQATRYRDGREHAGFAGSGRVEGEDPQPASHVLLRTRRPHSRLTPEASRSDAVSAPTMVRAARCCMNADNAKRKAAARASAVTATMVSV
jgi:hypothetical protein